MKDYSIFDSSGLTQTIKYDINYYWTGNGSLLTKSYTNLKFLIIRDTKQRIHMELDVHYQAQ